MFGVLAIEVASDSLDLELVLTGDARLFQPHISVLPRFTVAGGAYPPFQQLCTSLGLLVQLAGPSRNETGLWWYECTPVLQGYERLLALHAEVSKSFAVQPAEPDFWGNGYRPHITLGPIASDMELPELIEVRAVATALYLAIPGHQTSVTRIPIS